MLFQPFPALRRDDSQQLVVRLECKFRIRMQHTMVANDGNNIYTLLPSGFVGTILNLLTDVIAARRDSSTTDLLVFREINRDSRTEQRHDIQVGQPTRLSNLLLLKKV